MPRELANCGGSQGGAMFPLLGEKLQALTDEYRRPVLLCYTQDRTPAAADARENGVTDDALAP